jgi:tetratricopeptide (TPR) repeat protein
MLDVSVLRFIKRPAVHLLLIAALGIAAYSNTFNCPFQWDEKDFIVKNPIVKDIGHFLEPGRAEGLEYFETVKRRYVGYLSFALNYRFGGLDVTGYHAVNLAVHLINSLLVYLLVILTFRTPRLALSSLSGHSGLVALFSALLFVSHPVQTEAVTYVFQRLTSLMTAFYLLSLVSYAGSRLAGARAGRYTLYALSVAFALAAMKTKENAFTLPLAVALYEFMFFRGSLGRFIRLAPLILTMLVVPLTLTGADRPLGEIIGDTGATAGYSAISRVEYLLTEPRVVVTYLRLLMFPFNQNIDYDYPVFGSLSEPQVLVSILFLTLVFGLGVYMLKRSHLSDPILRLAAFGVFWFFMALSVESSVIPLPMVIDEYRVYLPSVGAFLALSAGASLLMVRLGPGRARNLVISLLVMVPVLMTSVTYVRNCVWQDEVGFWECAAERSPRKARVRYNLGVVYGDRGMADRAIDEYGAVLRLKPDGIDAADAHFNLGVIYAKMKAFDKAIGHYRAAVALKPGARAFNNLAVVYAAKQMPDKMVAYSLEAVRFGPDLPEAHFNLGLGYLEKGLRESARREFETVLRLEPGHEKALRYLDYISRAD